MSLTQWALSECERLREPEARQAAGRQAAFAVGSCALCEERHSLRSGADDGHPEVSTLLCGWP
jgi:hypothetical protein